MSLVAKNIAKVYRDSSKEVAAVNGISLEIVKGSSLAIIGPSGAGKSTLLHLLGGLDRPTSGKVTFENTDIYKLSDRLRAAIRNRYMGFVFQFYHLLPEFTAVENVMLPALIRPSGPGVRSAGIRNRARRLLRAVGLEDRADHRPGGLSGGESQRVAIARALINEPNILLCDEPTGNLDSKARESIYELLFYLKSKSDMALVIVTHDEKISQKTEKTVHIRDGKIV